MRRKNIRKLPAIKTQHHIKTTRDCKMMIKGALEKTYKRESQNKKAIVT